MPLYVALKHAGEEPQVSSVMKLDLTPLVVKLIPCQQDVVKMLVVVMWQPILKYFCFFFVLDVAFFSD